MSNSEYVAYRKYQLGSTKGILSRLRFLESKSTVEIVQRELSSKSNLLALEIGCGSGVSSMYLDYKLKMAPKLMIAVDVDKDALIQGQSVMRHLGIKNLNFISASATHLPLRKEQFDFVLCQEVIEHVSSPIDLLEESYRVTRFNGKFLITTPCTETTPLSVDWFELKSSDKSTMDRFAGHLHRFSKKTIVQLMESSGFKINQIKFTNQYVGSFFLFALALWRQKKLRRNPTRSSKQSNTVYRGSDIPNLLFMLGQTIDFKIFGHLNSGTNIILVADAPKATLY